MSSLQKNSKEQFGQKFKFWHQPIPFFFFVQKEILLNVQAAFVHRQSCSLFIFIVWKKQLGHFAQYLLLCYMAERKAYRIAMT